MKMPPSNAIDNKHSRMLNGEENSQIFRLLGNRCQSLSTTVAQRFSTEPPSHSQWNKREVGVLCFVKDNTRKNYFFRIFCLQKNAMVWEHEMYNNMEYVQSALFLHIFEGEDGIVAFNFSNSDEAREFRAVVEDKISVRRRREEKRTSRLSMGDPEKSMKSMTLDPATFRKSQDPAVKSAKRKRNITKADIGSPLDFKHISHVGWNPHSGFDCDIDSQDENLKCFFEKAGISEKQLQDKDTKEFIYDFINQRGGREAVEESISRRAPAVPSPNQQAPPVPPVPPRGPVRPHTRTAPPPPPPSPGNRGVVPSANSVERAVPPPPPPMAELDFCQPPPPPPMNDFVDSQAGGMNSALMESIRSGTTLKPVEGRRSPVVEDSRNQLLKEIREGAKLKPIGERDVKPINNVVETRSGDLAEALARALAERSKAIHSEDDDDADEDSNDDEWDD